MKDPHFLIRKEEIYHAYSFNASLDDLPEIGETCSIPGSNPLIRGELIDKYSSPTAESTIAYEIKVIK